MNKTVKAIVCVCGGSSVSAEEYKFAEQVGEALAKRNFQCRTGGYGGCMEASLKGCQLNGGVSEGIVVPSLYKDQENPYITKRTQVDNLFQQVEYLVNKSDVVVVLPGCLGSFNELIAVLTSNYINGFNDRPIKPVFVFKKPYFNIWECICTNLHVSDKVKNYVTFVDSLDELCSKLDEYYP
ncbi:hypothetical protein WA158_006031 [Blastocystis sp. Blastoise]